MLKKPNPAREALTRVINKAIADGNPVIVEVPANNYMVWALVKHNLKRAFLVAGTSFDARKRYAEAHGIPLTDVMARRIEEGRDNA